MTDDVLIWGAGQIGREINLNERQVRHLIDRGLLPVTKVGGRLVGKRSELRNPACWPKRDGGAT